MRTASEFFAVMSSLEFLPNTPTLMNAGRELQQLSACFVLPVEDSMESIFGAIKNAALVHQSGGGTGFSFSRLRPKNDLVKSTMGVASGPVSFMRVFDMATETIKQGGTRRGANMGILRVDHPDIVEFIRAKEDEHILNNFNISVGVTEEFMAAVLTGDDYALRNPRDRSEVGRKSAREIFDMIVDLAWKNGEPGIVFLDRLNRDNPTPHIAEIESTNPCGEQPLLPYESCNLGSINLALMVDGWVGGLGSPAARHQDGCPLSRQRDRHEPISAARDRRDDQEQPQDRPGCHGLGGHVGRAGSRLTTPRQPSVSPMRSWGSSTRRRVKASEELAADRGAFPNWEQSTWAQKGGRVRNATLTTIAPTGTISIIANCSSGVEPIFALAYIRNVMDNTELPEAHPAFEQVVRERGLYSEDLMKSVAAVGGLHELDVPEDLKKVFVTAHDVSPEWHIRMQAAFQDHVDNAVSKTVNFPNQARPEDVERVYLLAYELGVKGVTIYRDGSRQEQVLNIGEVKRKGDETGEATQMELGPQGTPIMPVRPSRSPVLRGETREKVTGCGSLYVTVNEDDFGPREVFANMGKAGGCASASTEAIGRLISLAFRYGAPPDKIVKQLRGIRCHVPLGFGPNQILSCPDAIGKALADKYHLVSGNGSKVVGQLEMPIAYAQGACPECGGAIEHEGGCMVCRACGYSKCA